MKINEVTKRTINEATADEVRAGLQQRLSSRDYSRTMDWVADEYNDFATQADVDRFVSDAAAERDNFWQLPYARSAREALFGLTTGAGRRDNTPTGNAPIVDLGDVAPTPSGASQAAQAAQDAGTMDPEQAVFTAPELTQPAPTAPRTAPTAPQAPAADPAPRGAAVAGTEPAADARPATPQPTRPGQQTSGANFGAITRNIRRGSRGDGVRALQQRLGINADGIFGPQTDQAVRRFQQQNNLQVDGIVGTQTLAALQGGTAAPGRITAAPATSVRPQARPTQTASKQNTGNALIEGIIKLAGVNKKSLNEASITINGGAEEISELMRMMQLAGASGAKPVDATMINQPEHDMDSCGCSSCAAKKMGPPEPSMGDMIRMVSKEEEEVNGDFQDATTEPDETYMNDVSASIPSGNDLHKEKGSYPATAGGDNPMKIKEALWKALAEKKKSKPDFLDMDKDGNKKEPMKKALKDKKKKGPVKEARSLDQMDPIRQEVFYFLRDIYDRLEDEQDADVTDEIVDEFGDMRSEVMRSGDKLLINHYKAVRMAAGDNDALYDAINAALHDLVEEDDSPKQEAEVQAPTHELSDTARKATAMAQKIKRKINSGDQMDDRDYNQMAELGAVLSRLGTSFGPKSMKDVLNHMIEYTDERNEEGHNYPEFNVDRFKELIAMAKE